MKEKTALQYKKIASAILKRYTRETDIDWRDAPMQFCEWLVELKDSWGPSTWRLRRSAFIYFMGQEGSVLVVDTLLLANKVNSVSLSAKKRIKRSSQKKSRKLSIADLQSITDELERSCGHYDGFIAKWLVSGLLVGVRPCEWLGAFIDKDILWVRNAKFSQDRSCGEFRGIHFIKEHLDDLKTVYEFVGELSEMKLDSSGFDVLYERCRRRLYTVNNKLWPHRKEKICFYTTRHQFSANAKATMALISVAAIMGHRSTLTSTRHYLHRDKGIPGMIYVLPDDQNIQMVDDKFKLFSPVAEKKEDAN